MILLTIKPKKMKNLYFLLLCCLTILPGYSQKTNTGSSITKETSETTDDPVGEQLYEYYEDAVEEIITELYYISDANDATDEDGGFLEEGSRTYRVFVDMMPGFGLQLIGTVADAGFPHTLKIQTNTSFFNNEDRGVELGQDISSSRLDENTVALDSWITIGAASDNHVGILKSEDTDGSIIGGVNNDGGSAAIAGGLLVNEHPLVDISLTTADGLIEGRPLDVNSDDTLEAVLQDLDISEVLGEENSQTSLILDDGVYRMLYVPGGVKGPTAENRVLVGQFTTTGNFTLLFNMQIRLVEDGCGLDIENCKRVIAKYYHDGLLGAEPYQKVEEGSNFYYVLNYQSDSINKIVVGLGETLSDDQVCRIYPNPASEQLNIDIPSDLSGRYRYDIYDMNGRLMSGKDLGYINNGYKETVDIMHYTPGIYMIRVYTADRVIHNKIVKQ